MPNKNRLNLFYVFVFVLFALLFLRLFYLKVVRFEHYTLKSAKIRARIIPNIAPRGQIYDRNMQVLASSKPVFSAYILPVKLENASVAARVIGNILHEDDKIIYQKIIRQEDKSFEPLLIKDYIDFNTISLIEEQEHKLPGFVVGARNIRSYHHNETASHVLGYIGEINKTTLRQKEAEGYRLGDIIGLSGIEKQYENYLRGVNGGQQIEVDSVGRPVKILGNIEPVPGNNLVLTLDLGMQKVAEASLGDKKGGIVVMKPKTGEVLVLASHPAFDPEIFTEPISSEQWAELHTGRNPLHNRALTAYPTGSTFKLITAITALEYDLAKPLDQFFCPGYMMIGARKAACWKTHGRINFFEGMVNSCDVVFYNLGLKSGPDRINRVGSVFGLGERSNIDLPGEGKGRLPSSKWKLEALHEPWYPGDSMNLGIGQGFLQATPLQMAVLLSAIANKGAIYQPHLLKEVRSPQHELLYSFKQKVVRKINLKTSTWDYLYQSLTAVVERGTGAVAKISGLTIAGKTGTAEDPPRPTCHAWFVCLAPVENPEIAMAIFLENGGHGGTTAAPIAKDILKYFLESQTKAASANLVPSASVEGR
ncbi:MAG: penicillin-binding protein 2 [Candidatus Margulisiibacteriota bacterium]